MDGQAQIANLFNDVPKVTASSGATASALEGWLGRFLSIFFPTVTDVQAPTAKGEASTKAATGPRAAASANVRVGTDTNFAALVLNSKRPVLVVFTASWCGPCKGLAPIVEQVTDAYVGRLMVLKVDIDDSPGITAQYNVRTVPTYVIFSGGAVVGTGFGMTTRAKLEALFAKYL